MSALGHQRTFWQVSAMSALPSKADIPTHRSINRNPRMNLVDDRALRPTFAFGASEQNPHPNAY
jgi:hypothetical protein